MKNKRSILIALGTFLLLDGILSIYFGNSCLSSCANNNNFGNFVRIARAGIGGYLIYIGRP